MAPTNLSGHMTPDAKKVFEEPASAEQIREFQAWEKKSAGTMLLRYKDLPTTTAFGLKSSDVVTVNEEIGLSFTATEAQLFHKDGRYIGKILDMPMALLRDFLASLDGKRDLAVVLSAGPFAAHRRSLETLVGTLLGGLFLVPVAVSDLEAKIAAIEIVRFPGQSPYAMPRQYWANSFAVRSALDTLYGRLDNIAVFSAGLRGLHRLATMGANGRTYYGGAGGLPTTPGEFRTTAIGNHFDERKKWIMSTWMQLLDCKLRLMENGTIASFNNVPLLQLTEDGRTCCHLYGYQGEFLALQVNELRLHLAAARNALEAHERDKVLYHCALFHHTFAHTHPFNNINNSIAMNIVNDLLKKADVGVLPHLYFDHVAYFMQPGDYVEFFRVAAHAHRMNREIGYDRHATRALLEAVQSQPVAAG